MKYIYRLFLILIPLYFNNVFAGENNTIRCNPDSNYLSFLFAQNWKLKSTYYFSYVIDNVDDTTFSGALHTSSITIPNDPNPHLNFNRVKLNHIKHYSEWLITCHYLINNPEMDDMNGELIMSTSINDIDYTCKLQSNSEVICKQKA